ncbi:MAG: class I SAM-dependent rRNA methyltransferase [Kofleriaceae bacterium]|nr:class I SAM-dependent rRNA methyltransferase [Kofleriaceae bacterium]MCL4225717.1 class I SAM-dependent rRNA methyltransferase [Myxococcales bacterium]
MPPTDPPRRPRRRPDAAPIVRRNTVRVPFDVARHLRAGHPWVYREAVGRPLRDAPGVTLDVVDPDGELCGRGLYEGEGAIALRLWTRDDRPIDGALVAARVKAAVALRRRFLDLDALQHVRLVNGESDGLPGVAVERYADYLVVQLFSPSLTEAPALRAALLDALEAELAPRGIYEQRRHRSLGGEAPRQAGAELVRGAPAPVELEVREDDLRFIVDVTAPLSTGLFADLRLGRRCVRAYARDRRVLNLFSYTGAISVYAHAGGAAHVTAIDVAAKAHARARRNFAASGFDPETPEHVVGDTFKVLARFAERRTRFDLVALDPPAFASAAARGGKPWSAVKDYAELVAAALGVLEPGGLLAAASSTHKVSADEFDAALADGAAQARATLKIIDRAGLPPDFPVVPGFPEGNYLKFALGVRS